ncbi:MAG: hypothetical protein M1817_001386 [Caeruleum heppii]|nr:MAG: hypothetical protein M1817_001386 [Caeruleum heppii]
MDFQVESWTFELNGPCELFLLCNRKRFVVTLSPDPPQGFDSIDAIEVQYLKRLDAALEPDDRKQQWEILKEMEQFVLPICQHWFHELAPFIDGQEMRQTLDILLAPETFMLQVVTSDGEAKVIRREDLDPPFCRFRATDTTQISTDLPSFLPAQIEVLEKLRQLRVMKVSVGGEVRCCKLAQFPYPDISREIQALHAITTATLDPSVRVPRLEGLVKSEDGLDVIGFLMDYIEVDRDICAHGFPRKPINTMETFRRKKWADQTEEIIKNLHESGIVWGDAKADNILIDSNDDVWLIDFGGVGTDGWVDREMRDSRDGDLHGLGMLRSYLML